MSTDETPVDVATIPPIRHREASALAATAYDRLVAAFENLDEADWGRPTDCEGWTVEHLARHVLGAMRSAASLRELVSQQLAVARRARQAGVNMVDAMTQIQIERASDLSRAELVAELRRSVPLAARGRRRTPGLLRAAVRFPVEIGTIRERWSLGYLVDVILTRDAWLHRVDVLRAVDRPITLTADHDGRIVADIVAEWARRHGRPFRLQLGGPAGGVFRAGTGGEELSLDAVEFCRVLSGRASAPGLLTTPVPF